MKTLSFLRAAFLTITAMSPSALLSAMQQRYQIQLELKDSGKVIGTPRMVVDAGNEAKFEVGPIDGETYTATVIIVPKDATTVEITSMLSARTADITRRSNYKTTATFNDKEQIVVGNGDSGKPDLALTATLSRL
jgi:hypothetical protein